MDFGINEQANGFEMSVREWKKIDGHVHFVGGGASKSGSWFQLRTFWDRFQAKMMLKGCGIPASAMDEDLDAIYLKMLLALVQQSSLDAVVLLAQDIAYTEQGVAMPEKSKFYVPNDLILEIGKKHPEFLPAVSIHPARRDAMDELEKAIVGGSKVMKILPNVINIDCNRNAYKPFWEKMASAGMVLLAHTGGEMTLPVLNKSYANPRNLTLPLECGVNCIAAHCAGGSFPGDTDYTEDLLQMFKEFPNLYGDNSALCTLNRTKALDSILDPEVQTRIIHGSDYPVPVSGAGPWIKGHLPFTDWMKWKDRENPLEVDYQYKKAMGFSEETFTRLDQICKFSEV